ncbi:hypothetical protein LTR37_013405 [Vermiconidia calcicola]|uniref:Uncharacterized protein n=1 Tax=Vermiconidia calcicola TaxID=1690605 RepID=A0ACC3MXZ4_9PEZI|nr:hypothetical protein LTR37_013405 [Vermiconidia calcicola]
MPAMLMSSVYRLFDPTRLDVTIQTYGYRVLADHSYEDAESCGGQAGTQWMDLDGGRCMRLAFNDNWTGKWLPAGEEITKAMEEKYVDEEGDHDWYICWPKDTFETPAPAPEEPPAEQTEPFPTERADTGCYSEGLGWTDLHGDGATDTQEVVDDINVRCQAADGTVLGLNDFWWDCTGWTKAAGGVNHIWYEIQTEGDTTDEVTITTDICTAALNTELDGCSAGSEQNHDSLWFMIDPGEGVCPFKK